MYFHYQRSYRGPVQAVILDWAGTTVDFGSLAPVIAFTRLFAAQGIDLGLDEARGPMGTEKREHIRRLCALPRIAAAWRDLYGESPDEATIDRLYHEFVPLQVTTIRDYAQLIPGCRETLVTLRARGISIGANTGYEFVPLVEAVLMAGTGNVELMPSRLAAIAETTDGRSPRSMAPAVILRTASIM